MKQKQEIDLSGIDEKENPRIDEQTAEEEKRDFASQKDLDAHIDQLNKHKTQLTSQKRLLNCTFGFIIAILSICIISYITFLLDSWKLHTETIKEYKEIIHSLKQDNDIKVEQLNKRIGQLEKTKKTR